MKTIQKTIYDLNTALNMVNDVSIITLESKDFERLLAGVHGILTNYRNQREFLWNSLDVLKLTHQMLERILTHHIEKEVRVSKCTLNICAEILNLLFGIVASDFKVNEAYYKNAVEKQMFLRALKASGITPVGHLELSLIGPWHDNELEESRNKEALKFAADNIQKYSDFVFYSAENGEYVLDLFANEPYASHLEMYEKIKSLDGSYNLLLNNHL